MIHPPLILMFVSRSFSERVREAENRKTTLGFSGTPIVSPLFWRDRGLEATNLGLSVQRLVCS
jgi:hypothetical protein